MTPRLATPTRVLVVVAALIVTAGLTGCVVGSRQRVADTALILADFAERLRAAEQSSYTATYRVASGEWRLVHRPPETAVISESARYLATGAHHLTCAPLRCARRPSDAPLTSTGGFTTPARALELVLAAALLPDATVDSALRTVAGMPVRCATLRHTDADFSLCVTTDGLLASFNSGQELTGLQSTVDTDALRPPPGVEVADG